MHCCVNKLCKKITKDRQVITFCAAFAYVLDSNGAILELFSVTFDPSVATLSMNALRTERSMVFEEDDLHLMCALIQQDNV